MPPVGCTSHKDVWSLEYKRHWFSCMQSSDRDQIAEISMTKELDAQSSHLTIMFTASGHQSISSEAVNWGAMFTKVRVGRRKLNDM